LGQLAGGNFDGKPGNEIVACTITNVGVAPAVVRARAIGADGKVLWTSDPLGSCLAPMLADLERATQPLPAEEYV